MSNSFLSFLDAEPVEGDFVPIFFQRSTKKIPVITLVDDSVLKDVEYHIIVYSKPIQGQMFYFYSYEIKSEDGLVDYKINTYPEVCKKEMLVSHKALSILFGSHEKDIFTYRNKTMTHQEFINFSKQWTKATHI